MHRSTSHPKTLWIAILIIVLIGSASLIWILAAGLPEQASRRHAIVYADIYQDGVLLESINLSAQTDVRQLTVTNTNGNVNQVEIRPGSIGILSADCPDKLCVHQGFISTSLLPITCLPNKLVIQIRYENTEINGDSDKITPDIITY